MHDLLKAGAKVRVIGRSRSTLQPFVDAGAEPFEGDPTDKAAMREAFKGVSAAWVMLQPNYIPDSPDFRGFQTSIIDAVVPALAEARVEKIVSLSSWGAGEKSGTGPVLGLHDLEQALNALDADVLHLRAGYYMENLMGFVDQVAAGQNPTGAFGADIPMPFIATTDVGAAGGDALKQLDFSGKMSRELHGPKHISFAEAFSVIGGLIGRPKLAYQQIPLEIVRQQWLQAGLSENVVDLMVEVITGINEGAIKTKEVRSSHTTTPTTIDMFARDCFIPAYEEAKKNAVVG